MGDSKLELRCYNHLIERDPIRVGPAGDLVVQGREGCSGFIGLPYCDKYKYLASCEEGE